MKNFKTALTIGLLFLFTNSFAQTKELASEQIIDEKGAHTYFDLMINLVSTNINYGNANSLLADYKQSNNGIQAGVSFQAGITKHFSLVSELYFIRKGGKLKSNNPLTGSESTLHLNALELPVLARLHLGRFYVNAGPSITYTMSGNWKIDGKSTKILFDKSSGAFRKFDAAIQVGGGFEFPVKQKRIAVDIRYVHGLTDITYEKEMYNRALMVSINFSKAWKTNPLGRR